MKHYFIWISLLMLLYSCKPTFKTLDDVNSYIAEPANKLTDTTTVNGISARLSSLPSSILTRKSSRHKSVHSASSLDSKKYFYFLLSMSRNGQELLKQLDYNLYSQLIPVFSFRMKDYIRLSHNKNLEIEPIDCFFQQTYGVSKANQLLIVVAKDELKDAEEVLVTIKEFGLGIGELKFNLDKSKIDLIDNLNYNKIKI